MVDLNGATMVEVLITEGGTKLWVNVDGVCQLRVQGVTQEIMVNDDREDFREDFGYDEDDD